MSETKNLLDKALDYAKLLPFYNLEAGNEMFIAGGACTRMFFEHKSLGESDIDVYCSPRYHDFLVEQLHEAGFGISRVNKRVTTLVDPLAKYTFQCIKQNHEDFFFDVNSFCDFQAHTLDSFDLSACQFIYIHGKLYPKTEEVRAVTKAKKLRVTTMLNPRTYGRIIKYMSTYKLSLDLEDDMTAVIHKEFRKNLLSTFPAVNEAYDN